MVLMEYSGAGGKPIHEKNQEQKSRDIVPLIHECKVTKTTRVYLTYEVKINKHTIHFGKSTILIL
jgi:hypothetical protein